MIKNNLAVVLLGAPGSGKGTLAKKLVTDYNFVHVSTGDLFRKTIASGSELGNQLMSIVASGALVSDEVTNSVMKEELLTLINSHRRFILDGYPRTPEQAKFLDNIVKPDLILLINVEKDLAIKRIVGRRLCPQCGAIYNIYFNKPKVDSICDFDGAFLIQRKDDNEETINKRFELYEQVTQQLATYYAASKKLHNIDVNGGIDQVYPDIVKLMEG
ncbi:adenylate kinase [Bacilli bacterium]|nr:adenylate kinase [Bacilli bacterium]